MPTVTLEEAQARLPELIEQLQANQELVITRDNQPVAKLVGPPARPAQPCQAGSAAGMLVILEEDDEHLEDFKEYMP
jgi:antitoxin (DNA-binding transcriptional repressor) of toxin-antitoxin stability system